MKIKGAHVVFHRLLRTGSGSSLSAVLLCKRTLDAPTHPGHWALIGGTLEDGEEPAAGALREVEEELVISPRELALAFLCDIRIRRGEDSEIGVRYFTAPLNLGMDELTLRFNPVDGKVEGEGLGWFTAEEIHHLPLRPEDRVALQRFFEQSGL